MAWDFSTDPEFEAKLQWADAFVRNEIEPLDLVLRGKRYHPPSPEIGKVINPLKDRVREQGLWAYHLPEYLGGSGASAVNLALLNEILGRSWWAPVIFGAHAPDTGNAEILAKFGTQEQKDRYLQPLLAGEIFSCYAMTEPQGGADPSVFTTRAVLDGEDWRIDGMKFFASNARTASFFIVMAVTDPDVPIHRGASTFVLDAATPGLSVEYDFGLGGEPIGTGEHALLRLDGVRLPRSSLLGEAGQGFTLAQARLGGGRLHHAMRTVGQGRRAFEMLCERAVSRRAKGRPFSEFQLVQEHVTEAWIALHQFRLQVLHAAWVVDHGDDRAQRDVIAGVKITAPRALQSVVNHAIQVHGALGISNQLPLWELLQQVHVLALADGPVEVHSIGIAKRLLRDYPPSETGWPSELIAHRMAAAELQYPSLVGHGDVPLSSRPPAFVSANDGAR